jgi:hypothetical protein
MAAIPGAGASGGKRPDYSAYFYALPANSADPLYLYGDLRPAPANSAEAHLRLRWELKPDGPTPQRIRRSSHAVGGLPVVLQRLVAAWPAERTVNAEVTATFVVDEAVYTPRPALRLKTTPSRLRRRPHSEHQLTQTAVAWSVDPPSGPVQRLSVARLRATELAIVASGSHRLTLGPDIKEELEGAVWEGVVAFLKKP